MRNLLLSGIALSVLVAPALAADLAPSFKAPIYVWTGVYIGGHAGGAFGGEDATNPAIGTPVTYSTNPSGFLGGVQAGYNYQFSPSFLVGAEADMSWSAASGNYNFITHDGDGRHRQRHLQQQPELVRHCRRSLGLCHRQLHALRQGRRRMDER